MKLILKIANLQPRTLPAADMAALMAEYANLLGEKDGVHFVEIRHESIGIGTEIDVRQRQGVRQRMRGAVNGSDPAVARHKLGLNRLLSRHETTAELFEIKQDGTKKLHLRFEGKAAVPERSIPIKEHVSVQGVLHRIQGRDDTAHIGIDDEGQLYSAAVTRAQALEIAPHMFKLVRVEGMANLQRNEFGVWEIGEIKAEIVNSLSDESISVTIDKLRSLGGFGWSADPRGLDALADLQGDE